MSVRAAAGKIGVSHSTVARAVNGETVEVETLVKIAEFLGVPMENILELRNSLDKKMEQLSFMLGLEPELSDVLMQISQQIKTDKLDTQILSEIAAFASFRLHQYKKGK